MYLKLFTQILDSSIADDRRLRHFFTDFMLCADLKGIVMMTEAAIARRIGATIEEVRWGIAELEKPDPMSKTTDNEGRRIERMEGHGYGWRVINFEMYHAMKTAEEMREKTRIRVQNHRAARKAAEDQRDEDGVTPCNAGNACNPTKTHTKTHTQTKTKTNNEDEKNSSADADESDFFSQAEITPKKETVSSEGTTFAHWFRDTLPEKTNMPDRWEKSFAQTYDDLVRLDGRNDAEIRRVCQWARTDSFWSSNFQSPAKLRKRNKDGIQYYDVFLEKAYQTKRAVQKGTIENIQLKILNGPHKNV